MSKNQAFLMVLGAVLFLSGCGKGIDAKLATESEPAYRASLNRAWQEMSAEQQEAYNWAVSNFTLEQLVAKYPSMTPRTVISKESDEYIKLKTQQVAATTADFASNADRLAREEKMLRDVEAELAKLVVTGAGIANKSFGFGKEFVFVTKNDSQFDISSATWDAWLFIDGEQKSDRHCRVRAYYKIHGGLPRGKSVKYAFDVGFMDCNNWDTLEVRNAKNKQFQLKLDNASVENFSEKKVLPTFSPTRADYEKSIKAAKDEIEVAMKAKATLL